MRLAVFGRNPQVRFLTLTAVLTAVLVCFWYWALLGPFTALRVTVEAILTVMPGSDGSRITVDAAGDWKAPVPLRLGDGPPPPWLSAYFPTGTPARLRSVRVTVAKQTASLFTLALPLFWAILLAAPGTDRKPRALAWGTVILAAAAPVSCLLYVGHKTAPYLAGPGSAADVIFQNASYIATYAAPYCAPVALALALYPPLRRIVLPWEMGEVNDPPTSRRVKPKRA